jgi:hypothetical protein
MEKKGLWGEFVVNMMAKGLLDKETYHLVENVTLPTEGGTTQIDHIIVSQYGIFVVETKNMTGWIFGSEHEKEWTQRNNGNSRKFQNPLRQNYKHTRTLAEVLDIDHTKLFSLIVFVGESEFKTEMPENVTERMEFINYISSKKALLFSESEVQNFLKVIDEIRLPPGEKTDREHLAHLQSIHAGSIDLEDQSQELEDGDIIDAFEVVETTSDESSDDLAEFEISDLNLGLETEENSIRGSQIRQEEPMVGQEKKAAFFKRKTVLAVCIAIVVVAFAIFYFQPVIVDFINKNYVRLRSEIQKKSTGTPAPSQKDTKPKEYNFTDEQIKKAMREIEKSKKIDSPSSQPTEGSRPLYEIEFVSGGRVYSQNVAATKDTITFENDKGLVVSVHRSEVKSLKRLVQKKSTQSGN